MRTRRPLLVLLACLLAPSLSSHALTIEHLSPAPGDTNITAAPQLTALLYNTSATNLTVTFFGRPTPSPIRPNFTIIALPDTQFYPALVNGGTPEIFYAQTEWIITNRVPRNIVLVTHLGDCVNNGEIESQWWYATNAMYRLEDPARTFLEHGIPYGICPGNHDLHWPQMDFRLYNKYFGVSHFSDKSYYAGHYGTNNDNHFSFVSASGLDMIVLYLEWNAGVKSNVMAWANSVLQTNLHRRAIVVTHSLLEGNAGEFNAQGQPIYDGLKANTNIFLMLCGHWPEAKWRMDTFNGNTIRTFLSDYSNQTNGGNGYLRIMEFSPSNSTLRVQSYSPYSDDYLLKPRFDFTVTGLNLSPVLSGYAPLFTISNCQPGVISGTWDGLAAATSYDWYVAVSDETTATQSVPTSFRTSPDFPGTNPPPAEVPYIFRTLRQSDGRITLLWRSIGGGRYRVEFKDALLSDFVEIIRSQIEETDPMPPGAASVQSFTDDFSLTGGFPAEDLRLYRVKRIN